MEPQPSLSRHSGHGVATAVDVATARKSRRRRSTQNRKRRSVGEPRTPPAGGGRPPLSQQQSELAVPPQSDDAQTSTAVRRASRLVNDAPAQPAFPRDEREREVIERVRSRMGDVSLPPDMLYGFVRGNAPKRAQQDVTAWSEETCAHLHDALGLLREVNIDRQAPLQPPQPNMRIFDVAWPFVELGQEKSGRIVVLDCLGRVMFERLRADLTEDDVLQAYAERMESVRRRKLALAQTLGIDAYYHTTILDLRGLSFSHLKKENRSFIQRSMSFSSVCYPETVHRIYIINAPAAFPMIWRVIRGWLDPVTATKIQVLGSNAAQKVKELSGIDLDQLKAGAPAQVTPDPFIC